MNCRECADFLMQYLSGELPQETSESFARHLAKCRNCDEYLKQYRETILAGRKACAHEDQTAPAMPEELIRAILAAKNT